jgi:phosphoribosylaminoimidazole carboxylase / phosphoribosylaminoimidazole-succinocarboxamide synthase
VTGLAHSTCRREESVLLFQRHAWKEAVMTVKKGALLAEGKTKRIWRPGEGDAAFCVLEAKDDITAHDDPRLTRRFGTKGRSATATTCRVFELLRGAGLPVAYCDQLSPTEFMAMSCRMYPLELVARRYATGSYLKRHPYLRAEPMTRFHRPITEWFLKTTRGECRRGDEVLLTMPADPLEETAVKLVEDPMILDPSDQALQLRHPKLPLWDPRAPVGSVLRELILGGIAPALLNELLLRAFLVLEGAWQNLGFRLVDLKIECGLGSDGRVLIADVIDNDSWRLRDRLGAEVSKQLFRDGVGLEQVEEKYAFVAAMADRFRIPSQVLVLWRGSDKDPLPEAIPSRPGVCLETIVCSGHKQPETALEALNNLQALYPDGGVIIALVGKSDGLGPLLAARTEWPVIAVCTTMGDFPDDVWSSIRMPRDVPLLVASDPDNALLSALNILGRSNPAVYAGRRMAIEALDR